MSLSKIDIFLWKAYHFSNAFDLGNDPPFSLSVRKIKTKHIRSFSVKDNQEGQAVNKILFYKQRQTDTHHLALFIISGCAPSI